MKLTKSKFFKLAIDAGFEPYEPGKCSASSKDDSRAYFGEYACGETLLELANLLCIEITEDAK